MKCLPVLFTAADAGCRQRCHGIHLPVRVFASPSVCGTRLCVGKGGKKPAQLAWCLLNCGAWCPPMGDVWDPCSAVDLPAPGAHLQRGLTYKDPCLTCWPSVALSSARIVTSESLLGDMYITNPKVVTGSRAACRQGCPVVCLSGTVMCVDCGGATAIIFLASVAAVSPWQAGSHTIRCQRAVGLCKRAVPARQCTAQLHCCSKLCRPQVILPAPQGHGQKSVQNNTVVIICCAYHFIGADAL